MRRVPALGGLIGTALAVSALAGCSDPEVGQSVEGDPSSSPPPAASTTPGTDEESQTEQGALLLLFGEVGPGPAPASFVNSGQAPLKAGAVTWGTGRLGSASSPGGPAVRLPAYDAKESGFAILTVVNDSDSDVLSPGDAAFWFGADFMMDKVTTGTPADDGDNLIQRGLFEGSGQYKIQVDDGRLSCRVRGLTGEVIVAARTRVVPDTWYRVRCTRRDSTVTVEVGELPAQGGPVDWTSASSSAPIGTVIMPSHTPLSVGGKLAADGTILPSSTDQFNGAVDRVFYGLLQ